MNEALVKLCRDEVAHARFKQLYGEKPLEKSKALKWEYQRLAFFLAWDSCKKHMVESIAREIREFFEETEEEYTWINSKGEKFISQKWLDEFRV